MEKRGKKKEEGKLGFATLEMEVPDVEREDAEESKRQSKEEDEELCSVYSTMEDFDNASKRQIEAESEDERLSNIAMVMVEEEAQAITTEHDSEIEEIIQVSLKGVKITAREVEYCSQWVTNNVQKFSKQMGVSFEGV